MPVDNIITKNICYGNKRGILLVSALKNIISNNNCSNNDIDEASYSAGISIAGFSDENSITDNICNNNNNAGAGAGYGIYIDNASCDDNTVIGNIALNNDTNYLDNGTNTFDSAGANPLNNFVEGAG